MQIVAHFHHFSVRLLRIGAICEREAADELPCWREVPDCLERDPIYPVLRGKKSVVSFRNSGEGQKVGAGGEFFGKPGLS